MPRRVSNPPNPWKSNHVEWLEEPPAAALEVYEEEARSILNVNESPDVPFRWGLNPYRGCQHACAYCYARPTHQFIDFGAGSDFDTKIVVKLNAEQLLREALAKRSWKGEWIAFSGVTDCYQPLEASYELTRRCLAVARELHNPVGIITKGTLVRRDADLLADLAAGPGARVFMSIPFADEATGRAIEPFAPAPARRFETLRVLSDAGVETGVAIAPLIPGLNDSDVPTILERARDAGARHASLVLLRLPQEVRGVFEERLAAAFPDRARKVLNALDGMRLRGAAGAGFGERMRGRGPRWDALIDLFEMTSRRLGLRTRENATEAFAPVQRPGVLPGVRPEVRQGELFGE